MRKLILAVVTILILITTVNPAHAAGISVVVNGEKLSLERQPVWDNDRILVPARTVFAKLGAKVDWYPGESRLEVIKGSTTIVLKIGDKAIEVNKSPQTMDAAPVLVNGTVMIPVRSVAEALQANVTWDGSKQMVNIKYEKAAASTSRGDEERTFVVVIDAGHGGSDPGAVYGGVKEKDLNLDIAVRLNALLKEAGIKTYMTRTKDVYVDLYDRSGIANDVNADLFISIHNNAHSSSGVKGSMSLYYPYGGNSKGNLTAKTFASIVQKELTGELGTKNLGIIQRPNLAVLRTTDMPAVIAEVGYMTNETELKNLKSQEFKQDAAEALKNAVLEALEKI